MLFYHLKISLFTNKYSSVVEFKNCHVSGLASSLVDTPSPHVAARLVCFRCIL